MSMRTTYGGLGMRFIFLGIVFFLIYLGAFGFDIAAAYHFTAGQLYSVFQSLLAMVHVR